DRLLDLHDHVGGPPHLRRRGHELGPGADVAVLVQRGTGPGVLLDQDLVAGVGQLAGALGRERDTELVVLDLAWDADDHGCPPGSGDLTRLERTPRGGSWTASAWVTSGSSEGAL